MFWFQSCEGSVSVQSMSEAWQWNRTESRKTRIMPELQCLESASSLLQIRRTDHFVQLSNFTDTRPKAVAYLSTCHQTSCWNISVCVLGTGHRATDQKPPQTHRGLNARFYVDAWQLSYFENRQKTAACHAMFAKIPHFGISQVILGRVVNAGNRSKLPETQPVCFQMDFQLLLGLLVKICCEFRRVRNRPILSKRPGLYSPWFWRWLVQATRCQEWTFFVEHGVLKTSTKKRSAGRYCSNLVNFNRVKHWETSNLHWEMNCNDRNAWSFTRPGRFYRH